VTLGPHPYHEWIQLEQPRLGSKVSYATDEFFAAKERLIEPAAPVFIDDKYDDHGKWMDGWESRRRRQPGHDHCVIRLGVPGIIRGVDIDTSHFTGNYPPQASIDACVSAEDVPEDGWQELVATQDLAGDANHLVSLSNDNSWTHLRLNIFPDGGIARLRVFGEVRASEPGPAGVSDLVALGHGGRALSCSDEHFGSMHNLNLPGRGVNMGDGWETRRRREPGNDWCIIELGHVGVIERVIVDTAHFKGNYPDRCSLQAARVEAGTTDSIITQSIFWPELLPPSKLEMDNTHEFAETISTIGPISHVRLNLFPDGGVSRLRLMGKIVS